MINIYIIVPAVRDHLQILAANLVAGFEKCLVSGFYSQFRLKITVWWDCKKSAIDLIDKSRLGTQCWHELVSAVRCRV